MHEEVNTPSSLYNQPTASSQPVPPPHTTSGKKHNWILWLILGVILGLGIAGLIYYFLLKNTIVATSQLYPTPVTTTSPTASPTSNWQTYTNSEIGITVQYPPTWSQIPQPTTTQSSQATLTGPEGSIILSWGSGFGGGCPVSDHIKLPIANQLIDSCDEIATDGTEVWSQIGAPAIIPNTSISVRAIANTRVATNRIVLLKILSTLSFSSTSQAVSTLNWQPYTTTVYSFEYPTTWFVNTYASGNPTTLEVSDIANSPTTIAGMSDTHTRIDISANNAVMPASFPYTNGSSANNTITTFSMNALNGIRGEETSPAGLMDVVDIENPQGGYVSLQLIPSTGDNATSEQIFTHLLSTFQFSK